MEIRRAHVDDEPKLTELARYVYALTPDSVDIVQQRHLEFIDEYYVVETNDEIVARARLIPFEQNIRQARKKMGGIASVASAPETRRTGNIRELTIRMLSDMHDESISFSTLLPFRADFYARFGYVKAPPWNRLIFNPSVLHRWQTSQDLTIRRGKIKDTLEDIRELHNEAISAIHGSVIRNNRRWKELSIKYDNEFAVVFNGTTPQGYINYSIRGYGNYNEANKGRMYVKEWYWLNEDARNTLLNFVFLHSDQVTEVSLPVKFSDNDFYHWVERYSTLGIKLEADVLHMARCVDVGDLLEGIPVTETNPVNLKIRDPVCKWNNQSFKITSNGGQLSVEQTDDKSVDTTLTIEGLTSLVYGSLTPNQLTSYGWISGKIPDELNMWFPLCNPYLTETF